MGKDREICASFPCRCRRYVPGQSNSGTRGYPLRGHELRSHPPLHLYFVALTRRSYVWGTYPSPFQTLKSNLAQLTTHGAFTTAAFGAQLPRTIKDSVTLLRTLELRYLWVDRLCIVQYDDAAKPRQLASMASIYSNADFTIAARDGDAKSGLAGISHEFTRTQPYRVLRFRSRCTMTGTLPALLGRKDLKMEYSDRGWSKYMQMTCISNKY